MQPQPAAASRLVILDGALGDHVREFAEDVRAGLGAAPKALPCRYFYDDEGSRLFEAICETPEYYLTRAEHEVLQHHGDAIAALVPSPCDLAELGSGNARKTRQLIEALGRRQSDLHYVSVDVSRAALESSADHLLRDYPDLRFTALAAEYRSGIEQLARMRGRPKLVLWLGSNIGNLDRAEAGAFLALVRGACGPDDRLLVGFDLRKGRRVLEAAYDDAAGVTAAFNLNVLARINRELGGRFDLDAFQHRATWDERRGAIDMHLVSRRAQRVGVAGLGRLYDFAEGEAIHTESSFKYSPEEIADVAERAGLRSVARFTDGGRRFAVVLFAPR
jgi:dimethylhistidine N-methyltransferase